MELYLVRHGETYLNRYQRMQGWSDSFLTPRGESQARACGPKLAGIPFTRLYASDSGRTQATAQLLLPSLTGNLAVEISRLFRETAFRGFEGAKNAPTWAQICQALGQPSLDALFTHTSLATILDTFKAVDPYHNAEDNAQMQARLDQGLAKIRRENAATAKVLLVTHGNYIRMLKLRYAPGFSAHTEIVNAGVTKLVTRADSWVEVAF